MRVTCLISLILRIELISHHWPELKFSHMLDVGLYSLFAPLTRLTTLPNVRCGLVQGVCIGTRQFVVSLEGLQAYMMKVTRLISLMNDVGVNL